MKNLFSGNGRLRRRSYAVRVLALNALVLVLYAMLDDNLARTDSFSTGLQITGLILLFFLVYLVMIQVIRRLHDVDKTGWLVLLLPVPVVGFLVSLGLLFVDGTPGANRFGPDPKGRVPYVGPENRA